MVEETAAEMAARKKEQRRRPAGWPQNGRRYSGDAELGQRLWLCRDEHGLTMREVARGSGVSAATISQIEHGQIMPSLRSAVALAAFYETSLDELTAHMRPERTK